MRIGEGLGAKYMPLASFFTRMIQCGASAESTNKTKGAETGRILTKSRQAERMLSTRHGLTFPR